MDIIIYGSEYGTAKQYAMELSKRTKIKAVSYEQVVDINLYGDIICIGSLCAGGVLGMKKTFRKMKNVGERKITLITVGLADPADKQNTDHIKSGIKKQVSKEIFDRAKIYHLRGGIDYSKLSFKHKTMMGLLYKKAINLPEEQKTAEVRAMIETYNKKVSFVDLGTLDAIRL